MLSNTQKNKGLKYSYLGLLSKKIYSAFSDVKQAKALVKRTKFVYIQNYLVDEALAKKMAENNNIFVVAISDFFFVDVNELKKRLAQLSFALRIMKKYGVKVRFFTFAKEEFELRNFYEILFFAKYFGFDSKYLKTIEDEEIEEMCDKK